MYFKGDLGGYIKIYFIKIQKLKEISCVSLTIFRVTLFILFRKIKTLNKSSSVITVKYCIIIYKYFCGYE